MAHLLYRRETPDGTRYRLWYTVSDTWERDEETREQFIATERGLSMMVNPEAWLARCDADPERLVERWFPNAMESDCQIFGHCEPGEFTEGVCGWCGRALYDVLG